VKHPKVQIFDTTLRDGEQSPGIAMTPKDKVEIALALEALGVDVIEAGFALASCGDYKAISAVARAVTGPTVASLARTKRADLERAAEALEGAACRTRIHTFIGTSPIHVQRKLRISEDEVLRQTAWAVAFAKDHADEVEFSCEDATRSEPDFLAQVCREAIAAGASVINLPDTVGRSLPHEMAAFVRAVRARCPELDDVVLSVHCHDDLGLAVANSMAGVSAGARQVECTINGIGERAGNASLEEVVMILNVRGEAMGASTDVDVSQIGAASKVVERITGYAVPPNKAIVGANAFAHEAGIHQDGMLKDAETYQIMDPAALGLEMTLPLGKHSGRHAFAHACEQSGVQMGKEQMEEAFQRFKLLADEGRQVSINDVIPNEVTAQ
jgi:2-isopropylmalate synthase